MGPGEEAGIGGGLYRVGGGVSAPRAIFQPDPEYSEEARKASDQAKMWCLIGFISGLVVNALGCLLVALSEMGPGRF